MSKARYDSQQLNDLVLQMMETELGGEQVRGGQRLAHQGTAGHQRRDRCPRGQRRRRAQAVGAGEVDPRS